MEEMQASNIQGHEFLGETSFAITARIALQLGRESISNSIVAIIELIKNSYDADAENVHIYFQGLSTDSPSIIIIDDGNGMDREQLEQSWLIIGTDTKKVASKSRKKGRILTGEKGLGRLGLDRLCSRTILKTFTEDEVQGIELVIDWTKYEGTNAKLESIKHRIYRTHKHILSPVTGEPLFDKQRGTILVLENLKDEWDMESLHRLYNELVLLISPFAGVNDFSISFYAENQVDPEGKINSENLLNAAEWRVDAELEVINEDAFVKLKMVSDSKEKEFPIGPFPWSKVFLDLHGRRPECGPLKFQFYYILREEVQALSLKKAQIDRFMNNNQGVRIYRDGFRVMPYGKPSGEGDWLGLGLRRTRSPTSPGGPVGGWKIGYNQILGAVFISRDINSSLLDQTNREGIVEGPPYSDLRRFALWAVENFERQYQKHYQSEKGAKRDEVEKARIAVEESLQGSKSAVVQLKENIQITVDALSRSSTDDISQENATQEIGKLYQMVEAVSRIVDEQSAKQEDLVKAIDVREEQRQQEFQRQKDTLGNLASLGILAASFGHETEASSNLVLTNSNELKHHTSDFIWIPGDIRKDIEGIIDNIGYGARKINMFARFTLRNIARDKRQRSRVFLDKIVKYVFDSFATTLHDDWKIQVELDFPDQLSPINAFSIDWESVIINFITNATWALEDTPADKRKIRVQITETEGNIILAFADSGFGISAGTIDSIFLPTFTTKLDRTGNPIGTGMGLAIVQSFVESYQGTIKAESPCELGGAKFIIQVPVY